MSYAKQRRTAFETGKGKKGKLAWRLAKNRKSRTSPGGGIKSSPFNKPTKADISWLAGQESRAYKAMRKQRKADAKEFAFKTKPKVKKNRSTVAKQGGKVYRRAGGAVRGWGQAQRGY